MQYHEIQFAKATSTVCSCHFVTKLFRCSVRNENMALAPLIHLWSCQDWLGIAECGDFMF